MNKNAVFIKNFTFREAEHIAPRQALWLCRFSERKQRCSTASAEPQLVGASAISRAAPSGISCETYRIGASRYITRPPQRAQYLKKYILAYIVSI